MITKRHRFRFLAGLTILVLGLAGLLASGPAASAAPGVVSGYHYYEAESWNSGSSASAFVQFHATTDQYHVWLNGGVSCPVFNGAVRTWCGWSNNGTNLGTAGVNYTVGGVSHYLRLDVYAAVWYGSVVCRTRGNATTQFVTYCAA